MKAENVSTALARVLVDELARCGVTDAVLAPGSRSAPLAMALHDEPSVRLHVGIDERSVGFLALGLAKASGRPVVVVTTSGTAAVNLHPAVVEAHESRTSLLVLTADRPPELRHAGANQTIDQVGLFGTSVRWSVDVGVPEDRPGANAYWRSTVCHAVATATGSPPGPVHLNLAFRDPLVPVGDGVEEDLEGRAGGVPWTALRRADRRADLAALPLLTGGRGVVIAGDGAAPAAAALVAFAEAAGWPLLAEPHSGARSGANAIACYHHLLGVDKFVRSHRPDVVVRVGRANTSRYMGAIGAAEHVLIDPDGAWLDPGREVTQVVVADPSTTLASLAERVSPASPGWLASWVDADAAARAAIDDVLDTEAHASEPRTARDLAAALPDGGALVIGSSMPVRDLDMTMRARTGIRVLGNRGASGIDGFVSTALGVARASNGPTWALTGDLSLLHDLGGLLMARPDDRLVLVVANNDGGGIFSFLSQAEYPGPFETVFGTPHGRDLGALVTAAGATHVRVELAADLTPAVHAAGDGTHVVEVVTDRTENVAVHGRLQDAVAAAMA